MKKKYKIKEFKYHGRTKNNSNSNDKIITKDSIIQPKFQRGLVWSNTKKLDFINTILMGYPFGSILLYKSENDKKYRIVDGLQRMNTLNEYSKNKFDFLSYENVDEKMCSNLIKEYYISVNKDDEIGSDSFNEEVEKLRKTIYFELKKKNEINKICEKIYKSKNFGVKKGSNSKIFNIIKDFEKNTSISNLDIPAIVYQGEYSDLPNIFYSLNVGGVKLSKYETYSSLWGNELFKIEDDEIVDAVKNKYGQLRKDCDFDVDIIDSNFEDGITLFEYCCALSDIIKTNYSLLFGERKKTTDPSGFELVTLICDMPLGKEEKIYEKLRYASSEFLVEIKKIIVEALNKIQTILKPWVIAKNGSTNITSSTYMIYHMTMSYILNNYNIDTINFNIKSLKGKSTLNMTEDFEKYLPYHYLKDTLDDFWSKHRQVSDLKKLIDDDSERYCCKIDDESWKETFEKFKEEQKNYKQNYFSFKSKLFIDYLVKGKINSEKLVEKQKEDEKYFKIIKDEKEKTIRYVDYEHIVTIESIESKYKKEIKQIINEDELPVYSLGNLCYLTSHINRSKKGKNIPQFEEKYAGLEISTNYRELVNYPKNEKLEFTKFNKQKFQEEYINFIEKRIKELESDFKKYVLTNIE